MSDRPFQQRRTDFGASHLPLPEGFEAIEVTVGDETWRVKLEPGEEPTEELRQRLEAEAREWEGVAETLLSDSVRERWHDPLDGRG